MSATITGAGGKINIPNNSVPYANFGSLMAEADNFTIADTTSDGITIPIYRQFSTPNKMTIDTTNNYWTHDETGIYILHMMYRQLTGGDIWTMYGVAKNGTTDIVGVTARMGSENAHTESFHLLYKVDDTTANYRIQGWCHSGTRTISGTPSGYPSGWTYSWSDGAVGTTHGKSLDLMVYKVSGL
jgi:hypothetical protein